MGSPSVVFDPEVLDDVVNAEQGVKEELGEEGDGDDEVGALILLGEKEHRVGVVSKLKSVDPWLERRLGFMKR